MVMDLHTVSESMVHALLVYVMPATHWLHGEQLRFEVGVQGVLAYVTPLTHWGAHVVHTVLLVLAHAVLA